MAPVPPSKNDITILIDAAHEAREDKPRPHMGASILGHPCDRWIWLQFRMAIRQKFPGRILRLFRRGHQEEPNIIADLKSIGVEFSSQQPRVNFGSHVSGSADAIIEAGVPEAPLARHVAEFKTTNKKGFDALEKDGVHKSKPEHWTQMQIYMAGLDIERALYVAVCKDDDRMYTERVRYDKTAADKSIARGKRLAVSDNIPPPLSDDPTWYQCRFCPAHEFCHKSKLAVEVNCRTCAHSTAKDDSTWRCERWAADNIPFDHQIKGCDSHGLHPDLVPWKWIGDGENEWVMMYEINGAIVPNSDPSETAFASREIIANATGCADETVREIKKVWPGAELVR